MTTPSMFPDITTRAERRINKRLPEPDFDAISMGAGVQGTTIALLIHHDRLPTPKYAIFADTGWEPAAVYHQLDRINRELLQPHGIELITVNNGNIRNDITNNKTSFSRIPAYTRNPDGKPTGMLQRTCTSHFKIEPLHRKQRQLLGATTREIPCKSCSGTGQRAAPWLIRYHDDHTVHPCNICHGTGNVIRVGAPPAGHWIRAWIGFSLDEMERCAPSRVPYNENWYPLLETGIRFSRDDCLAYLAEHGWGDTVKSACIGCPYHDNDAWRALKTNPEEWEQAVFIDAAMRHPVGIDGTGYLHKDRVPLALADISGDNNQPTEHQGCSPYGCRSGDPIDTPALWDDLNEPA